MEKLRHNLYLKLTIELFELSRKGDNTWKGRMAILVDTVAGVLLTFRSQKPEIPNVLNIQMVLDTKEQFNTKCQLLFKSNWETLGEFEFDTVDPDAFTH